MIARELTLNALKFAGVGLTSAGAYISINALVGNRESILARYYVRYISYLDKSLRVLFAKMTSSQIIKGQLISAILIVVLEAIIDFPFWYLFLGLVFIAPTLYLSHEKTKRVEALEAQMDSFILALANSLKTVPSPGAAVQAISAILRDPMRQEIEHVIKEMRIGNTLEQALMNMSARVGSRSLDTSLSAVLIGIQVGGNLPKVLETVAATIREMNRLDGVVKTKTSEGRAQLWVLAAFPFLLCGGFNWVSPGYFDPLQQSVIGYIVATFATMLWMASLIVARKVLSVDV